MKSQYYSSDHQSPPSYNLFREILMNHVQTAIIANELKIIARSGLNKVDTTQIPVICDIILPRLYINNEQPVLHIILIDKIKRLLINAAESTLDKNNKDAFLSLIGINETSKAETRKYNAAKIINKSEASFQKKYKNEMIKNIAQHISNMCKWITNNKDLSINIDESTNTLIDDTLNSLNKVHAFLIENPFLFRIWFKYDIDIYYHGESSEYATVETLYVTKRLLPKADNYYIYIYRSFDAMIKYEMDSNTVGVELAEVSLAEWNDISKEFRCSLTINKQKILGGKPDITDDYFRIRFDTKENYHNNMALIEVSTQFKISTLARRFPVKLSNHFVIKGIEINFTIKGKNIKALYYSDYFTGFNGNKPINNKSIEYFEPASENTLKIEVRIPSDILIWPNSGIEFMWIK